MCSHEWVLVASAKAPIQTLLLETGSRSRHQVMLVVVNERSGLLLVLAISDTTRVIVIFVLLVLALVGSEAVILLAVSFPQRLQVVGIIHFELCSTEGAALTAGRTFAEESARQKSVTFWHLFCRLFRSLRCGAS